MVISALQNKKHPERSALSCKATHAGLMPECSTLVSENLVAVGLEAAEIL